MHFQTVNNNNNKKSSLDQLFDVQRGVLLGSTELSGWSDALTGVRSLMLPQTLPVNEALPALPTLVGSLSGV